MPPDSPALPGNPEGGRPERRRGFLVVVLFVVSFGVLAIAHADTLAREGSSSKALFFWLGVGLICVPCAIRLCSAGASDAERVGIVLAFGLGLYFAKVAYSPSRLAFSDEFVHLRSTDDDLMHGTLFSFNPLLPEASRYPGLGALAAGLVRLTGLSVATIALIVIGSARTVMMLGVYLLTRRASGSARIAALACFLYAGNPNFLYWSAQFSYESLALPLVAFTLYLLSERSAGRGRAGLVALTGASIVAVVVTHHLSSYFLAAVLCLWAGVAALRRRRGVLGVFNPAPFAAFAVFTVAAWLVTAAPVTGQYLGSIASSTGSGLFDVLTGSSSTRSLFTSVGQVAPVWERILSIAGVLVTLSGLAIGALLLWRRRWPSPPVLALLALGAIYPVLLPLRFVGGATETANRSTEFVFVGVASIVAMMAVDSRLRSGGSVGRATRTGVASVLAALIVLGGVAVSWQYSERLPEDRRGNGAPYELGAQAIDADLWAAGDLGPGHRFASDFLDHLGLATYGRQRPLWAPTDHISAWQIMAPTRIEGAVREAITKGNVQYVMVDDALTRGVPTSGWYFDKGEPMAGRYTAPLNLASLRKFNHAPGASRIYDNGRQQIFAVAGLR